MKLVTCKSKILMCHIIAVTKEVSVERTQEVIKSGLIHLGENRPEGLKKKLDAIDDKCQLALHRFITNKKSKNSY